jgi:hypothetical protein
MQFISSLVGSEENRTQERKFTCYKTWFGSGGPIIKLGELSEIPMRMSARARKHGGIGWLLMSLITIHEVDEVRSV